VEQGGVLSLWKGLPPLLVRQIIFGMFKFLVFDYFPPALYQTFPLVQFLASDLSTNNFPAVEAAEAAAAAAAAAATATATTSVAAVSAAASTAAAAASASASANQAFAVFLGAPPLLAPALVSMGPQAVPLVVSLLSGLTAGVVATVFSQPADVVLTRLAQVVVVR